MTTVENQENPKLPGYEVLGRVLSILCSTPGPLADCLGFRLWPRLHRNGGYVLAWHGYPSVGDVADYLREAAEDDDMTRDLRPGDVEVEQEEPLVLTARGVPFALQPEPMLTPDSLAAMGEYWRTGSNEAIVRMVAKRLDSCR